MEGNSNGATPAGATPAEMPSTEALLASRLLLVTGKGGTGKTTFAAALAVLGALKGRRTVLCEVDSQRPSMASVFGVEPRFDPITVRPQLDLSNVSWNGALRSYLHTLVPSNRVVGLILSNAIVGRFLDFTPGSREMVVLSAIGEMCHKYDLVVVDMPASGHAFSLLDITRSALGLFRSGPVRTRAGQLRELLVDAGTRMVFVALPEEMVVNETIETFHRMQRQGMLSGLPAMYLNRATLPSLTDAERDLLARLGAQPLDDLQQEFVRAGRWEDELEQGTANARDRLAEAMGTAPVLVPPAPPGGIPRDVVEAVAVVLGRQVGITRRELKWT